jgi:hypothetical protein
MVMNIRHIESDLDSLIGLPLWGLKRTTGSVIFIELGKPFPRTGETVVHGFAHMLLQLSNWRITDNNGVVVGSDFEIGAIDRILERISLGLLEEIVISKLGYDLLLKTSLGFEIMIAWFGCEFNSESTVWTVYIGESSSWALSSNGVLSFEP